MKKKFYSAFDRDKGDYMSTGLNSPSRKQAIEDVLDYMLSDGGTNYKDEKKIRAMNLKEKEVYLASSFDVVIEQHLEKMFEEAYF